VLWQEPDVGITQFATRIKIVTETIRVAEEKSMKRTQLFAWPRGIAALALLLGVGLLLLPSHLSAQSGNKAEKEKQSGTTKLRIEVTAGKDGDAVDGASVYVRYTEDRKFRKDKKTEQNWKTNKEGIVRVPEVPRGKVLIQVIAPGWKTFGQWYDLDQDEQTIKIHLEKPPQWY
jgi:hypothetical protein